MPGAALFQLSGQRRGRLARQSVKLMIGLQLLLVLVVLAGVYLTTSHLRNVALQNMGAHAYTQTQVQKDRLEQSLSLLQMHLRSLYTDTPEAITDTRALRNSLLGLQSKLLFIRSIS